MKRIILITGGQRSGKSSYAEKLALSLCENPIYMATSRVWDEEFALRVKRHKEGRGLCWTNIEEEKDLSKHDVSGRVVLIDCVTLWGTNFFYDLSKELESSSDLNTKKEPLLNSSTSNTFKSSDIKSHRDNDDKINNIPKKINTKGLAKDYLVQESLRRLKAEFDKFTSQDATFIFVTNEIGMCGVSANKFQRQFTDMQGWANQYIASKAEDVVFMVSGIPMKIK